MTDWLSTAELTKTARRMMTKPERPETVKEETLGVPYKELFMLGVEMRRAIATVCDSSHNCTCTVCRAAWGWDHHFGAISRWNHNEEKMEEFNPHEQGWIEAQLELIDALDQSR